MKFLNDIGTGIGKGIGFTIALTGVALVSYGMGVANTMQHSEEQYKEDVKKKARDLIHQAAEQVLYERQQAPYDEKFAEIVFHEDES